MDPAPAVAHAMRTPPGRGRVEVHRHRGPVGEYFRALTTRLLTTRCRATPLAWASDRSSAIRTRSGCTPAGQVPHGSARDLDDVDVGQRQLRLTRPLARELHQPLHHAEQPVRAGLHAPDQLLALSVVRGLPEGVDEALDGGDRGPESWLNAA